MVKFRFYVVLALLGCVVVTTSTIAAERIDLSARSASNTLTRVSIELEAGGHSLVRAEDTAKDKATEQRLPMSVTAKLRYDERILAANRETATSGTPLAVRSYEQAEAVIKVDEGGRTPQLPEDRRLILVESNTTRPILYCADGVLSREQFDLIDVVGNSLYLDQLLPNKSVAKDETWSHESSLMGPLLTLDSVAVCEVKSILEGHNASFAKVRLAGTVHGTADGAATELEVRAVYLFDRRLLRVTRLNLAVRERRSIGSATPGIDAVAKLQIQLEPIEESPELTDEKVAKASAASRTPNRDLIYESAPLGFRFQHDRQWFVTSEQRESVTLRRIDRGQLVAQFTLTALPPKSAGRQTTLEQFQKDVTYSLGKNFGEMVSSRQWQNATGLYCYELVARGFVEEVPVEWHYYLVAPESGHRVSAAVTLEKPMVERIAQADREMIESLTFFPRMPAAQTARRDDAKSPR